MKVDLLGADLYLSPPPYPVVNVDWRHILLYPNIWAWAHGPQGPGAAGGQRDRGSKRSIFFETYVLAGQGAADDSAVSPLAVIDKQKGAIIICGHSTNCLALSELQS